MNIEKLLVVITEEFHDLFVEYCEERQLEWDVLETAEFETTSRFLVEFRPELEYDKLDDEIDGVPWEFADYLQEKYGENDPRTSD